MLAGTRRAGNLEAPAGSGAMTWPAACSIAAEIDRGEKSTAFAAVVCRASRWGRSRSSPDSLNRNPRARRYLRPGSRGEGIVGYNTHHPAVVVNTSSILPRNRKAMLKGTKIIGPSQLMILDMKRYDFARASPRRMRTGTKKASRADGANRLRRHPAKVSSV